MYCTNCGKEIPEGSRFCPHCGAEQKTAVPNEENTDKGESISDKIGDGIDKAGEDIGSGFKDAFDDLGQSLNETGRSFSDAMNTASDKADDFRKNWRDYLTDDHYEIFAAVALLFPLFMDIANGVLSHAFDVFYYVPLFGGIFKAVLVIVRVLFIVASAAGIAAIGLLITHKPEKAGTWTYVNAGGNILAFLACLGLVFRWGSVGTFFGFLCALYGIDAFSRVVLQKKGIEAVPAFPDDLTAYKTWYEKYKEEHPAETRSTADSTAQYTENSCFDGDGLTLFGLSLLTALVSALTFTIATPWMLCRLLKWKKTHTVIDGRRLDFNGTGGSLLGHWILWILLDIVTLGIYSFFMYVALRKWEMQHTYYQDSPASLGAFDGSSFQYFGYGLLQVLLLTVTLGLAGPWTITMIEKWEMKHCLIGNDRMQYEGTAMGILGQYIIVFLLSIVTFGIYTPWGTVRIFRYLYSHTHVQA